jgi:3-oxoacyl-[acyl-carrier protein] reductase
MSADNRTVFVTGGSRGIGRAIVEKFASSGDDVVFTYKASSEIAEKAAQQIAEENNVKCLAIQAEVSSVESMSKAVDKALEAFGKVDVLVNNAGIIRDQNLISMSVDEWYDVINTNLNGAFNTSKPLISTMLRKRAGVIINIASTAGVMGVAGQTNYCSTKSGLLGFTRALARECGPRGVRVNAVAPGFIETDMTSELNEVQRKEFLKQIPLRDFGQTQDIAEMAYFIASDAARYVTGQVFVVDGGLTA